ncbi:MAG: flagellar basal body rod protein FlgC [Candidatus Brocadia sp. AMX2]|uniref:Flagellar basal-body rod protein FlgC n=1 Tax=Candidatus Brocadia sinica JPN1 TaxID=1197129 RepID=A0ABQ0JZ76_9BACT|nr:MULTISPECIES: flagellar basal body rod protein FlgC [Brocadia]KXK30945.1 MAG: flagellar basal-body rod protein FlgC [Candidatus Brocadia sinica]MBC6931256.1 flagellar basal body rod protein FlgC [Candidatus Brocadia sp.]MBL1168573.1 flagellar basal body rod protein FlgC [Candidatus Brocadia sp. AMX1]NOG40107.1 flagellar basal body rod protein FlgC [Planctomycetota bacterium]KAA0246045.1 MAG: flagellar basal body rod protein FlgC [Candidatus Brocadia sp. AMX2]
MGIDSMLSIFDISGSGLSAERIRMNVIANNIANANATDTPEGGPYRKEQVEFSSVLNKTMQKSDVKGAERLGGVKVQRILKSTEPFNRVYIPGHPKADAKGFVEMPNVSVMMEMVDLVTATRSYEANLAVINSSKDMNNRALSIIGK